MSKFRIIVAGGREFDDYELLSISIGSYLEKIKVEQGADENLDIEFVSGGARGADRLGEKFSYYNGYKFKRFPADWSKHKKAAGPIRNREMAEYASKEHGILFAFWDGSSKGTKSMIELGNQYGLEVHVIYYEG